MKPQLRLQALAALTAVLMTTSAPADLVYIDLGRAANATRTVEGVTYNDLSISGGPNTAGPVPIILNGTTATTAPAPLLTTGNTGSGWGIQLELLTTVSNGQWGNNGSIAAPPYPEALSSIAPKALQDNLYMNRNHKGKITISGLDDAAQYTIILYSNETTNSGNASMTFAPVKGSGAVFTVAPINAYKNETDLVEWIEVSPEEGQIAFSIQAAREGWMNFMSIEEVAVATPFQLTITPNAIPGLYDFEWDSQPGKIYDLMTSTDLATPILTWPLYDPDGPGGNTPYEGIPSAGATTTLTAVPGDGAQRFFAILENDAPPPPPIFSEDFETDGGGFTATGTPNDWAWGTPNSNNNAGLVLTTGNAGSTGAWATNLGLGGAPSGVIDPAADSILRSPAINLTGVTGTKLSFAAAYDASSGDVIEVLVRNAATDALIATIKPITATLPASADWTILGPFDLSAADNTNIYLEFRYNGTDANFIGLYIDNVEVTQTP